MDRLDSLCLATPLFFHLTRFYFSSDLLPKPPDWLMQVLGR